MSDNNKSTGRKDSFAVPGDENIVSGGKSFFLSFGKPKKGPANPLIESEKQKAAAAEKNKSSQDKNLQDKPSQDKGSQSKGGNNNNNNNNGNNNNGNNGKGGRNDRRDRRNKKNDAKNGGQSEKPQADKAAERNVTEESDRGRKPKFGKGHNNRGNGGEAQGERNDRKDRPDNVQRPETAQSEVRKTEGNDGGNKGRNDRRDKRNKRNDRQNDKQNEKQSQSDKNSYKNTERNADRQNEKQNGNNAVNDGSRRNDRRDGKDRGKGRENTAPETVQGSDRGAVRPKHKKEKFVPSAPGQPLTDESLLQPIVNRTGIISGGTSGAFSSGTRSKFGVGAFKGDTDDKTVYIDKTRPLAEQIAERSRPQTFAKPSKAGANEALEQSETVEVIGVRFREAGKVYYFAPGEYRVTHGEAVIVETARGIEYGFCAIGNRRVSASEIVAPLKPILRKATDEDTDTYVSNKALESTAAMIFREKVAMLKLDMSLVYVEYTFDKGKLLFYFTADGRVDFRELIKELAAAFRTRIELRQIGVRDEAKIVGGLGICGRPVCCKSFLGEFSQVSIKMAKDQNLFLNSSKISGTCGRFMCCIRYEDEVYQKEYEKTPKVDAIVETELGRGTVIESNALKGMVKVLLDDEPDSVPKPFKSSEVKVIGYIKRDDEDEIRDEEEETISNS